MEEHRGAGGWATATAAAACSQAAAGDTMHAACTTCGPRTGSDLSCSSIPVPAAQPWRRYQWRCAHPPKRHVQCHLSPQPLPAHRVRVPPQRRVQVTAWAAGEVGRKGAKQMSRREAARQGRAAAAWQGGQRAPPAALQRRRRPCSEQHAAAQQVPLSLAHTHLSSAQSQSSSFQARSRHRSTAGGKTDMVCMQPGLGCSPVAAGAAAVLAVHSTARSCGRLCMQWQGCGHAQQRRAGGARAYMLCRAAGSARPAALPT